MKLRELILAAGIVLALVAQADAQERWSGWYGGLSLNAVNSRSNLEGSGVHRYDDDSGSVGAFVGYNRAGRGNYVWGGELALSGIGSDETRTDAALGASRLQDGVLLETKFRAGYATERAYYYGIAGIGFSDFGAEPVTGAADNGFGAIGFGVGAEFAIDAAWSVKTEIMHYAWEDDPHTFNATRPMIENELTKITLGFARRF